MGMFFNFWMFYRCRIFGNDVPVGCMRCATCMQVSSDAQQGFHAGCKISPDFATFDDHNIIRRGTFLPVKDQERSETRCELANVFVRSSLEGKKPLKSLGTG